jgi:branched-chain amino acid transport system ATP-binding protein
MISFIRDVVLRLRETGVATVLVEQRPDAALQMANHVAFMAAGRVVEAVAVADLRPDAPQFKTYVGV